MHSTPFFSIITPTYNRAHLLSRLYQSLVDQKFISMEWVVIDDGSTDDTQPLLARLAREAPFPVVVGKQENGGKHRALNHAAQLASGFFFVDIDSDDYFLPDALPRYYQIWNELDPETQATLGGMIADSVHIDGQIVGRPFPREGMITNAIDLRRHLKVRGDKLYIYKLKLIKKFPFPEFPGENFLQESVRHRRIAQHYNLRATILAKRVKDYQQGGLSAPGKTIPNCLRNPKGYRLRTLEATNLGAKENHVDLWKECAAYIRFALHCGEPLADQFGNIQRKPLWISALPLGVGRYFLDRLRFPRPPAKGSS